MKIPRYSIFFFTFVVFFSCQLSSNTSKKLEPNFIQSQYKTKHNAPFSDATEYNGILFLKGQIGKDHKTGKMVFGGIKAETKQVLTNIQEVLEASGSDLNHVLKCTVILSNIDDFSKMNEVYRSFLRKINL